MSALVGMVKVLVAGGATHTSAVAGALAIERGATLDEAYKLLELEAEPVPFDAQLLLAELNRQTARVTVPVRNAA